VRARHDQTQIPDGRGEALGEMKAEEEEVEIWQIERIEGGRGRNVHVFKS
jgi:hypothetical protein